MLSTVWGGQGEANGAHTDSSRRAYQGTTAMVVVEKSIGEMRKKVIVIIQGSLADELSTSEAEVQVLYSLEAALTCVLKAQKVL